MKNFYHYRTGNQACNSVSTCICYERKRHHQSWDGKTAWNKPLTALLLTWSWKW